MRKISGLFLSVLISAVMLSCSVFTESEKGSIVVPLPGNEERAASMVKVDYYNVSVNSSSYSETKKADSGETVEFSNLSSGSYTVKVDAYRDGSLYKSGTASVSVNKGETASASVTLKYSAEITDTKYMVLYNSDNFNFYNEESLIQDNYNLIYNATDFTFDANGNCYTIYDSKIYFYKTTDSSEGVNITLKKDDKDANIDVPSDLAYDCENKALYVFGNVSGKYTINKIVNIETDETGATSGNLYTYNFPADFMITNPHIAVFGGYLYMAGKMEGDPVIYRFTLSNSDNVVVENSQLGSETTCKNIFSSVISDYDEIKNDDEFEFTDIAANAYGVFVLLRHWYGFATGESYRKSYEYVNGSSNEVYKFYSRGAVVRLNSDLTLKSFKGWSDKATAIIGSKNRGGGYDQYFTQYIPTNPSKQFYGPSKFIALKPKQLVIADDGACVFDDGETYLRDDFKQRNRVITYDMSENISVIAGNREGDGMSYSSDFPEFSKTETASGSSFVDPDTLETF